MNFAQIISIFTSRGPGLSSDVGDFNRDPAIFSSYPSRQTNDSMHFVILINTPRIALFDLKIEGLFDI